MKKRLNQSGMTLIELLAAFAITTVIVVSVLSAVMSYRNRAQAISVKREIIGYRNTVVQAIQEDIYKYGLKEAVIENRFVIGTDRIVLNFSNGWSKELKVVHARQQNDGTISKGYISYADSVKQPDSSYIDQEVKYYLPYYGDIFDKNGKFKYSSVRFGQTAVNDIRQTVMGSYFVAQTVVKIVIPIYYGEGLNQDIEIIVPASYPVC